jgi:hypothetical protein
MKEFLTLSLGVILLFFYSCKFEIKENRTLSNADAQKQIASMLDSFHAAAARADYNRYFSFFSQDASFIGTDATEQWTKDRFAVWAKPYFDRGKAWSFTSIERHIYIDSAMQWAWFDELLRTQMKICRGSGGGGLGWPKLENPSVRSVDDDTQFENKSSDTTKVCGRRFIDE